MSSSPTPLPPVSSEQQFKAFLELFRRSSNSDPAKEASFLESLRFNFAFKKLPDLISIAKIFSTVNASRPFTFKTKWLNEEIIMLVWTVYHLTLARPYTSPEHIGVEDWEKVARLFIDRTAKQCMFKFLNLLRSNPIKKEHRWIEEEDQALFRIARFVEKAQKFKWTKIAIELYESTQVAKIRMGKHCRERWNNHLNPALNKGKWTLEEDVILLQTVVRRGRKWARISRQLKGRNEYSVKNRFYFLLKIHGLTQSSRSFICELKALIKTLQQAATRVSEPEIEAEEQKQEEPRANSIPEERSNALMTKIEEEEKNQEKQDKNQENQARIQEKQVKNLENQAKNLEDQAKKIQENQAKNLENQVKNQEKQVLTAINTLPTAAQNESPDDYPMPMKREDSSLNPTKPFQNNQQPEAMNMLNGYWNSLNAASRMNEMFNAQMGFMVLRQQQMQMQMAAAAYMRNMMFQSTLTKPPI